MRRSYIITFFSLWLCCALFWAPPSLAQDDVDEIEEELDLSEDDAEELADEDDDIEDEDEIEDAEEDEEEVAEEDEDEVEEFDEEAEEDFEDLAEEEEGEEDFEELADEEEEEELADEEEELAEEDEEEIADDEEFDEETLDEVADEEEELPQDTEDSLSLEPLDVDSAELPQDDPPAAPVDNSPNLAYEAQLFQIFQNYHKEKTPDDVWSNVLGERAAETYEIQNRDTLWGVSETLFGDGNYWPKVWSLNGGITNPHLIRPGNNIKFLLGTEGEAPAFTIVDKNVEGGEEAGSGGDGEDAPSIITQENQSSEEDELEIPPPSVFSRPVVMRLPPSLPSWQGAVSGDEEGYDELGFDFVRRPILDIKERIPLNSYVAEAPPVPLGEVAEIELGSRLANAFQYVYVRMAEGQAEIGDSFLVIQNSGENEAPNEFVSGFLGYSIQIQGEVRLTEKVKGEGRAGFEEVFRAVVTKLINPVSKGGSLIEGNVVYADVTDEGPRSSVEAQIIGGEFFKNRAVFGLESVAYLNRGSTAGLEPGQVLPIRANRKSRNLNSIIEENVRPVGWLKIVDTTENFATAIVVRSWSEIFTGDVTGFGTLSESFAEGPAADDIEDEEFDESEDDLGDEDVEEFDDDEEEDFEEEADEL